MTEPTQILGMYLHLARASAARRQPMVRDKLLVLAGVTALELELPDVAERCRDEILLHNAWHLVRKWPTLRAAVDDERFEPYLKQLRRRYSPERAEHMLQSLGIELARERESYYTDQEYALALLGNSPGPAKSVQSSSQGPSLSTARTGQFRPGSWLVEWGPFAGGVGVLVLLAIWRLIGIR